MEDQCIWHLDPVAGYSVKGVYHYLSSLVQQLDNFGSELLWHKEVPVKVSLLAWCLFWNRLPTKDNLFRRGIHS